MDNPQGLLPYVSSLLGTGSIVELSATAVTSFALIAAAEIGDKSQLVCMTPPPKSATRVSWSA